MSSNKNVSLAIGAFIVGAVFLVFIALLFFSGGRLFADKERVVMYFEGSVQGLQVGAPVKLKGVVLGEIVNIEINFQRDDQIVVTAVTADLVMKRINSDGVNVSDAFLEKAIANGLRAQLNYQSFLTGLLYVELDFYPGSLLRLHEIQKSYVELPTIATSFEEISRSFQELDVKSLVDSLNNITSKIDDIVGGGQIQETLGNFNRVAESLERTSNTVDREIGSLGADVKVTLNNLNHLMTELNNQAPKLTHSLDQSLGALQDSLENFDQATNNLNQMLSDDAPLVYQLNRTLSDISRSAQAFQSLSETLDQQPESLLRGRKALPEKE
jgi:paraquat-inducible protein B